MVALLQCDLISHTGAERVFWRVLLSVDGSASLAGKVKFYLVKLVREKKELNKVRNTAYSY